jgi:hypothetical protein
MLARLSRWLAAKFIDELDARTIDRQKKVINFCRTMEIGTFLLLAIAMSVLSKLLAHDTRNAVGPELIPSWAYDEAKPAAAKVTNWLQVTHGRLQRGRGNYFKATDRLQNSKLDIVTALRRISHSESQESR